MEGLGYLKIHSRNKFFDLIIVTGNLPYYFNKHLKLFYHLIDFDDFVFLFNFVLLECKHISLGKCLNQSQSGYWTQAYFFLLFISFGFINFHRWLTQYIQLTLRTFRESKARIINKMKILESVVLAVVVSLIWFQLPRTEETLRDRMGAVSVLMRF